MEHKVSSGRAGSPSSTCECGNTARGANACGMNMDWIGQCLHHMVQADPGIAISAARAQQDSGTSALFAYLAQ